MFTLSMKAYHFCGDISIHIQDIPKNGLGEVEDTPDVRRIQ